MDVCEVDGSVVVSRAVVEARVRRAVSRDGQVLRKTRPGTTWAKSDFGDYYTACSRTGNPVRRHFTLEQLARDEGVLQPFETLAAE